MSSLVLLIYREGFETSFCFGVDAGDGLYRRRQQLLLAPAISVMRRPSFTFTFFRHSLVLAICDRI
jgi:hypothetical protein